MEVVVKNMYKIEIFEFCTGRNRNQTSSIHVSIKLSSIVRRKNHSTFSFLFDSRRVEKVNSARTASNPIFKIGVQNVYRVIDLTFSGLDKCYTYYANNTLTVSYYYLCIANTIRRNVRTPETPSVAEVLFGVRRFPLFRTDAVCSGTNEVRFVCQLITVLMEIYLRFNT